MGDRVRASVWVARCSGLNAGWREWENWSG